MEQIQVPRKRGRGGYFTLATITLILLVGYIGRRHSLDAVKEITKRWSLTFSSTKSKHSLRVNSANATTFLQSP
jgi:hypothetical protein